MRTARRVVFQSFLQAGFECSSHRRRDGRRLDLIASTRHDEFAEKDYRRLNELGIDTVRDGIRWHLVESEPGCYDFRSAIPMIRAARDTGTQVIWDLCHYGWPDDLDVFSPAFITRFGAFARAFARLLREETEETPLIAPLNEPSFVAWLGGDKGHINPFQFHRGFELKQQLIRATIEAVESFWQVTPEARMLHCEPAIHIIADPGRPGDAAEAEYYRLFQFQALDMLIGRMCPELGGHPRYADMIGINYYWNNQWFHNGRPILRDEPQYRPFRELLGEFHQRYQRPLFIAETGNEDHRRAAWFHYVASEVQAARSEGLPIEGICLYPVVNHPGWDNDRHCFCGLFDYADDQGNRTIYQPLAEELKYWQAEFAIENEIGLAICGGN